MDKVLINKLANGLGIITLNRPEKLNATTHDMMQTIYQTLHKWSDDPTIKLVLFNSTSERAFCAGGDLRSIFDLGKEEVQVENAVDEYKKEYEAYSFLTSFPKPIISLLKGITMGGGVGFTYGTSHRIVTENTRWAMPETNIGFYPDAGAAYFFNLAPGYVGRYAALTARQFNAADTLYMKTTDTYIHLENTKELVENLQAANWLNVPVENELDKLINQLASKPEEESFLEKYRSQIDEHFKYDTMEEIFHSLKQDDSSFAQETLNTLQQLSPISLKVTLEFLKRGQQMTSIEECFAAELIVTLNFFKHEDFHEGVRAILVDKDYQPDYKYKKLADVSDELVQSFFR